MAGPEKITSSKSWGEGMLSVFSALDGPTDMRTELAAAALTENLECRTVSEVISPR